MRLIEQILNKPQYLSFTTLRRYHGIHPPIK